jgi:hypothetical protein
MPYPNNTKQLFDLALGLPQLTCRQLRLIVTACRATIARSNDFESIVEGASIFNFTVDEIVKMKAALKASDLSILYIHELATIALYAKWHPNWDEFSKMHPNYQPIMEGVLCIP